MKSALPDEMYRSLHALQARRVGALLRHRLRLGRAGIPRRAALRTATTCGIAGIIYRDGSEHAIGDEMTRMLQAMKHRGPDSTGYALYGNGENGNLVMRYKLADANTPRDFDFEDRLRRHRTEVEARSPRSAPHRRGRGGDAVRVPRLVRVRRRPEARDFVEDIPEAEEVLARPGARDREGPRRRRVRPRPVRPRRLQGHARDRARAHGDGVGGRHRRRASVLGLPYLDVAVVHNGQLTNYFMWRRRLERAAAASCPSATRDHRRLPRRGDVGASLEERCTSRSTSSTASSRTSP